MATKYEGLTTAQWANRIVEYNPGKFDKSLLIKHYTAQQLGKFQEGGNIQLAKALKGAPKLGAKTPAKGQKDDAIKFFKSIKKTPNAPARGPSTIRITSSTIEQFLRQIAAENGTKINFGPGRVCQKDLATTAVYMDACFQACFQACSSGAEIAIKHFHKSSICGFCPCVIPQRSPGG